MCQCGEGVQTEQHVLCDCTLVSSIREAYGNEGINFENFITSEKSKQDLTMIKNILKFYEDLQVFIFKCFYKRSYGIIRGLIERKGIDDETQIKKIFKAVKGNEMPR